MYTEKRLTALLYSLLVMEVAVKAIMFALIILQMEGDGFSLLVFILSNLSLADSDHCGCCLKCEDLWYCSLSGNLLISCRLVRYMLCFFVRLKSNELEG